MEEKPEFPKFFDFGRKSNFTIFQNFPHIFAIIFNFLDAF